MSKDYFKQKADSYEEVNHRVENVRNISKALLSKIVFNSSMKLMDFGSGTGLLLESIAPYVQKITAIDVSPSMNEKLNAKREKIDCELDILELDLSNSSLDLKFDGIISSMTMHHVEDIEAMFKRFYSLLNENGFIAIADLDTEDGSFHKEDTGVYHTGFERTHIQKIAVKSGFTNVSVSSASMVKKPQGDYPVFLITGHK
ncbi:MAG: class I SAM-dependent methyltransferase [Pseudomonadales bacterium]|nr:class I SAM-dependent methyltransferase [Pseudomonadales bacterium]